MPQKENSTSDWKDTFANKLKQFFDKPVEDEYHFTLSSPYEGEQKKTASEQTSKSEEAFEAKNIFASLPVCLEYIKVKYNTLINSDIILREFTLLARNRQYKALLFFIDGMVDSQLINNNVLEALMMRNRANIFDNEVEQVVSEAKTNNITVRKIRKFNLEDYIFDCLLPQNNVKKVSTFAEAFSRC
ncbi:MAG: spore germination protein [Clostridia bacterium]|nr:spore germination protein [Clostridia bacterium]